MPYRNRYSYRTSQISLADLLSINNSYIHHFKALWTNAVTALHSFMQENAHQTLRRQKHTQTINTFFTVITSLYTTYWPYSTLLMIDVHCHCKGQQKYKYRMQSSHKNGNMQQTWHIHNDEHEMHDNNRYFTMTMYRNIIRIHISEGTTASQRLIILPNNP